ncbi:hypothetical protein GTA08_BOTSDO12518 [Botryosphaeria dothidea]|uniref:Uncharacterized protein n=1 Tax=Botryosphaeria dothidea TaxID=55169 RepID=A0A8H4J4E7_9PEZI|nr:hypothetical protein GTA08_BOTSDO02814 [Botryosphaeria dothidea]KAF4311918.1 hypothetical protein GTA08_BOTSDO12518 [Botryosphaeria dothidea]
MKLRDLEKIDYKDADLITFPAADTVTRTPATTKARGRKPGAPARARQASNAIVADQERTATGRVAKTSAVPPKRGTGRPLKSPSKRGPGCPPKNGPSAAYAIASRVARKAPSRRVVKREYEPVSPIVKIEKKSISSAREGKSIIEHPTSLMHKFFRAHEDDVTHIPKKKQRKALGKMWRESTLNPKNARAEKESGPESGSVHTAPQDEDEVLTSDDADELLEEAMGGTTDTPVEQDQSDSDEQ